MDVLPLHFCTLKIFGVWYDTGKQHWLVKYLWQPFTVNVMVSFTILQLGALSIYRDNINDFTECLFLSLTYVGLLVKLVNFLLRHDAMDKLLEEFRDDICKPRDDHEREVLKGYQKMVALVFNLLVGSAQMLGLSVAVTPLIFLALGTENNTLVILPYKTYEVYDKDNSLYYWGTYLYEVSAAVIGTFVNAALDTMLAGFLLMTCGQIDLCCYRFSKASNDEIKKSTVECVLHHTLIQRIVRKLEGFFMCVVLPYMFLSLITFCTSIYNISQTKSSGAEIISFAMYLVSLLCELGCYCWFGNELKLKSSAVSETVYNSDWTTLKPSDRRHLYFIMLSCQKDLTISYNGFCALSTEIFVWVLKTSYGAYNLLKTVE